MLIKNREPLKTERFSKLGKHFSLHFKLSQTDTQMETHNFKTIIGLILRRKASKILKGLLKRVYSLSCKIQNLY